MIELVTLSAHLLGTCCACVVFLGAIGCGVTTGRPIERGPSPNVALDGAVTPSGLRATPPNAYPFSQTCQPDEVVVGYRGTEAGAEPGNQLVSLQGYRWLRAPAHSR
jgi:hypothetical protein